MTYLSLFSGVGGLDRALPGRAVAHVEWDAYAQRVLRRHWPDVPVLGDVRTVNGADFRGVDLVVGGPPCQAASHAGLQLGEADPRWMWPEAVRIVREAEPQAWFFENVMGLLTLNGGRSFGAILSAFTALGFFVRWDCCTAAEVGRPHRRDRVWIVGTREVGPRGWLSVPIPQVRRWPRAGWAWEGRTGEDVPQWPIREVWPLVCPEVCPHPRTLWPTPSGGCFNDAEDIDAWTERRERVKESAGNGNGFGMPLGVASRLWPTPQHHDHKGAPGVGAQDRGGFESSVAAAVKLWPTPRTEDSESAGLRKTRECADTLTATTRLWPTPGALDANNRASATCARDGSKGGEGKGTPGVTLVDALRMWPTPNASDAEMVKHHAGKGPSLANAAGQWDGGKLVEGRLNPAWVEQLLCGWPIGWTLPEGPSLAHEPAPPRDVELAPRLTLEKQHRRDRLRCTGNGVVTETAALVFRTMMP